MVIFKSQRSHHHFIIHSHPLPRQLALLNMQDALPFKKRICRILPTKNCDSLLHRSTIQRINTTLWCLCISAHSLSRCCLNYSDFLLFHRAPVTTRLLSQGHKVNCLSNTFKKFYGRHMHLVGQYQKNVCEMFADSIN